MRLAILAFHVTLPAVVCGPPTLLANMSKPRPQLSKLGNNHGAAWLSLDTAVVAK